MNLLKSLVLISCLLITACSSCDENEAYNKMLAFQRVQGRLAAMPGDGGAGLAASLGMETTPIGELIGKKDYSKACKLADEIAGKWSINLKEEQKGMITMEQLKSDGGKGAGTCTIADAAKKQMELHGKLQAEVDAGKRSSEIFREFGEDTKGYAEMLSTDPSAACKLFDDLAKKYKVAG